MSKFGFGGGGSSTSSGSKGFGSSSFGKSGGSGFGSSSSSSSSGGGFGKSSFGSKSGSSGGGFGSSSFGSKGSSSGSKGFGSSSFGGGKGFGSSSFGSSSFSSGFESGGQQQMTREHTVMNSVSEIQNQYDIDHESCPFRYAFYEMKPHAQETSIPHNRHEGRPHQELLHRAQAANPDPEKLATVQKAGFEGLMKRAREQDDLMKDYNEQLDRASETIVDAEEKYEGILTKLEIYQREHKRLCLRVLSLLAKIEVIQGKGFAILPEEEHFKAQLEAMQWELNKPTQFKGMLNEVTSQMRRSESVFQDTYETLDDDSLKKTYDHLVQFNEGVSHLTSIVKEDLNDVQIMLEHRDDE
eukprot:TRINITY_DN7090_c0_g1_i1.p1 TRINITY_DN7090_c0_g1~~TRINITY_DN7090_c0_g1_i1.p1  ORF type:complete len:381 (+),score=71.86 TRINITY_DN7090_c0_g1_i1:80-1144(+)